MGAPRIWSSLVLLFALVFAPAAQAEDHRAAVTAMMEKSGLRGQLANIGDTFRLGTLQSIEEGEEAFSEEQLAALADIGERSLEDPSFIQDIEAALADSLSASEIDAVSEFYASPLGQRIKAAELEASTAAAQTLVEARKAELRAELERDPERLATFRKIDEFLHASEISATTAMSIAQTIWAGVLEEQSEGSGPDAMASLDGALEALYPQILAEVREYVLVSSAWTYRDFSLEEVRIYMEFLQSAAARATYAALQAGLSDAMEKRGQEIGRAFGQVLKQRKA